MKKLENFLKSARNGLIGLGLSGILMFGTAGCTFPEPEPLPNPDPIVIDLAHTGMIMGQVFSSKIENNQIGYEPYKQPYGDVNPEAYVWILDTDYPVHPEFETVTVSGGYYSIDNIPTGTHIVTASRQWMDWGLIGEPLDRKPVTVIKQQTTIVPDLKLLVEPILTGKIYNEKEKETPFGNKEVKLYKEGGYPEIGSTITSSDGSYAFKRSKDGWGNITKFCLKNDYSTIMFSDTDSEESEYIPFGYDIKEEDAYVQ